jgi:central glycolytic genes regulator
MQLEDLSHTKTVVAIAGGKSKAKAIESYFRQGKSNVLITDEGAAEALIKDL